MSKPPVVEFYEQKSPKMLVSVESAMVPTIGSMISIKGVTWEVSYISYSIDHSDNILEKRMRANVEVVKP